MTVGVNRLLKPGLSAGMSIQLELQDVLEETAYALHPSNTTKTSSLGHPGFNKFLKNVHRIKGTLRIPMLLHPDLSAATVELAKS